MWLSELTHGLVDAPGCKAPEIEIVDVTDDSRQVQPGSLFIARRGAATHGSEFITEAIARGAVAIVTDRAAPTPSEMRTLRTNDVSVTTGLLAERFFGEPSRKLKLIGVTGTNGKTTTVHLIQQILDLTGHRCGLIGTICIDDGVERMTAHLTTPGAIELSRTLARMVDNGCECCVLETSSHAIDQGRVGALDFNVAVFTNLTGDHLDYHGSIEQYASAKARLFASLSPDAVAVLNFDDPRWRQMASDCGARKVLCTSDCAAEADARVSVSKASTGAQGVVLDGEWGTIVGSSRLLGSHNRMNLLQAIVSAHAVGADVASLVSRLHELSPPPGRMEPVELADGPPAPMVLVDYAHTDDALANALKAVRPLVEVGGRLWVVFGCGGDRDVTKRPRMGVIAVENADVVVITSDNPRTEEPMAIVEEIAQGARAIQCSAELILECDRERAIERAVGDADARDLILIAGKGHEDYQILPDGSGGTVRRDFDDRVIARRALESRAQQHSSVRTQA